MDINLSASVLVGAPYWSVLDTVRSPADPEAGETKAV